jgi:hypothetical protein
VFNTGTDETVVSVAWIADQGEDDAEVIDGDQTA